LNQVGDFTRRKNAKGLTQLISRSSTLNKAQASHQIPEPTKPSLLSPQRLHLEKCRTSIKSLKENKRKFLEKSVRYY
jgi:hypothetical protein